MQQFFNWRFDVSGMTPAQINIVITALNARIRDLNHSGRSTYRYGLEEEQVLTAVVDRLERALPENKPLPDKTIV